MELTQSKMALIAGALLLSAGFYVGVTIVDGGFFCLLLILAGLATFVGAAVLFSREQAEEEAFRARSFERNMNKMKEAMLEEAAKEAKLKKKNGTEEDTEEKKTQAVAKEVPKKPGKKVLPSFTGEEDWDSYPRNTKEKSLRK